MVWAVTAISWVIFTLCTCEKMNEYFTVYLAAYWLHNCIMSHITKLQVQQRYLQFETDVSDRFSERIWLSLLLATFAESGPPFVGFEVVITDP